jgi:hypothetical protein
MITSAVCLQHSACVIFPSLSVRNNLYNYIMDSYVSHKFQYLFLSNDVYIKLNTHFYNYYLI